MAFHILEEVATRENLDAVIRLVSAIDPSKPFDLELGKNLADCLNFLLSFHSKLAVSKSEAEMARRFLHALLTRSKNSNTISSAYCALRTVGNEESIALIRLRRPMRDPWDGIEKKVVTAIRKAMSKFER